MTSRKKQLAFVNEWLAQNPRETLTSLARRAGLATTTLTRWANTPNHPQQVLKSNTFDQILLAMGKEKLGDMLFAQKSDMAERAAYASDSVTEVAPLAPVQTSALVYLVPRPIASVAKPLGTTAQRPRALDYQIIKNPNSTYIWALAQSNAMDPNIPQGAFVLVELDVEVSNGSGIYLIAFNNIVDLRRLDVDFEYVIVSADRPGYKEHHVRLDDHGRLRVLGRAVCVATQTTL